MALPFLIEKADRDWILKNTKQLSENPDRDVCLLYFFFATGMTTLEINRVQLKDVLSKSGELNKEFITRSDIARTANIQYPPLRQATRNYIEHRVKNKIARGNNPDHYLGLEPDESLFISNLGKAFSIVRKQTPNGNDSFTCDALNRHIKQLLKQSGVEEPSILSGRRTYAVNLQRRGFDLAHIHRILGNKTVETTKKLLSTDPVDLGWIASHAY